MTFLHLLSFFTVKEKSPTAEASSNVQRKGKFKSSTISHLLLGCCFIIDKITEGKDMENGLIACLLCEYSKKLRAVCLRFYSKLFPSLCCFLFF